MPKNEADKVERADGTTGPVLGSIDTQQRPRLVSIEGPEPDTALVSKWNDNIARYYYPEKNTAGLHFPDVPLDDIFQGRWDALSEQVKKDVDACGFYGTTPPGEDEEWSQTQKAHYVLSARGLEPHTSVVPGAGPYPSAEQDDTIPSEKPAPTPAREDAVALPANQPALSQEARGRTSPAENLEKK